MEHPLFEEVLDSLNDFPHYLQNNGFLQFSASGEVVEKITIGAEFGDDVAMGAGFVYFIAFDDVGVVEALQDLNLVVQHFQTLFTILLELDYLYCALLVVIGRVGLVDLAAVARTDLLGDVVAVVTDRAFG